jgi:hypothetical protein
MIKLEKFYMSAGQDLNTETCIYVKLLDEGTDVWRPVRASVLDDSRFIILKSNDYDPETEIWEFPPETRVRCIRKAFADGDESLVAIAIAE